MANFSLTLTILFFSALLMIFYSLPYKREVFLIGVENIYNEYINEEYVIMCNSQIQPVEMCYNCSSFGIAFENKVKEFLDDAVERLSSHEWNASNIGELDDMFPECVVSIKDGGICGGVKSFEMECLVNDIFVNGSFVDKEIKIKGDVGG